MAFDGIKALLEEGKTKRWLLDENQWTLERWLELIPFSDRPGATLDALELLELPRGHRGDFVGFYRRWESADG